MEKVRISGITKKDSGLVIVSYVNDHTRVPGEATLNTKWQSQEVDYLEKDVGIGGEVSVLIEVKGQYTNITKVDMTSAVKGEMVTVGRGMGKSVSILNEVQQGERSLDGQVQKSVASERGNSIICQCLLKIAGDGIKEDVVEDYGRIVCGRLTELIAAYKLGLSLLD